MRTLFLRAAAIAVTVLGSQLVKADEGGLSFWLPGQYGSLTALPQVPGWQIGSIYYHSTVAAAANAKFPVGEGNIQVGLDGNANLGVLAPAYVFADPVLGGQATVSLAGIYGNSIASVDATITGPNGRELTGHKEDSRWGFGDLYPTASLRWNKGVNNFLVYATGDIPVGAYDPSRLANLGIGHGAIDGGAGYTYFNPATGNEFSVMVGLTYNLENPDTDYQNGIDSHIDWGLSKFLTPQFQVGVAGYFFRQLTGDSGSGAVLGDFESQVAGIGPQIGYLFPAGDKQGYLNLRGYYEFAAENRASGWNALLTFAISPKAPGH